MLGVVAAVAEEARLALKRVHHAAAHGDRLPQDLLVEANLVQRVEPPRGDG